MIRGDFLTVLPNGMPTLKALTYFFELPSIVWLAAVGAVLTAVWKIQPRNDWEYSALVAASVLIAPHMHQHELVVLLIPAAIVLSEFRDNRSAVLRWFLFALMLWHSAVRALFDGGDGKYWPVMPLTIAAVFSLCLYIGKRTEGTTSPAEHRHLSD
jgi:hypothetical protein